MTFTDDELLEIVEEVTLTFGELLLTHRQLTESFMQDHGIEQTQDQIEKKKQETAKLKDKLRKIKDASIRRRELERIRDQHEKESLASSQPRDEAVSKSKGVETISDQGGRVVGYKLQHGKQTVYMNSKQRVVAREVGGDTYNKNGAFIGKGRQGLRKLATP